MKGIYCIENRQNNFVYIGRTNNIAVRWKAHLHDLFSGSHVNHPLQNDWNVMGPGAFIFYVLLIDDSSKETESDYIQKYKSNCYNLMNGKGESLPFKKKKKSEDGNTTVRIERAVKYDIEQIAVLHWRKNGEKLDAGQIVKMMVDFFKEQTLEKEMP